MFSGLNGYKPSLARNKSRFVRTLETINNLTRREQERKPRDRNLSDPNFAGFSTPYGFFRCKMLFEAVGLPLLLNPESVGKEALSVVKYVVFVFLVIVWGWSLAFRRGLGGGWIVGGGVQVRVSFRAGCLCCRRTCWLFAKVNEGDVYHFW